MQKSSLSAALAFALTLLPAFWSCGCKITTCEEGATCDEEGGGPMGEDDDDDGHGCPSEPIPGGGASAGGSGSSGGGGEGGDAGGAGGAGSTACEKSCECPEGESCVGGFCAAPEPDPEPVPCADDCDCPSGQLCVSGTCG